LLTDQLAQEAIIFRRMVISFAALPSQTSSTYHRNCLASLTTTLK